MYVGKQISLDIVMSNVYNLKLFLKHFNNNYVRIDNKDKIHIQYKTYILYNLHLILFLKNIES